MKKVVFVEDDTADGGLGMVFRNLANHFATYCNVFYVSTRPNDGRIPNTIQYFRFHEDKEFEPHTNGIRRSVSGINGLRRVLKEIDADVVISFGFYSNIRLCLACIGLKCKVLISERGNATRFHGIYRLLVSILLFRSNRIVFQSVAAMKAYPSVLGKKGIVINNAIFKDQMPDASEMEWAKRIVSVGRIHPDKNFRLLLEAFSHVALKYPDYHLEIFGEEEPGSPEPYLDQLKSYAVELGIQKKVYFMGQSSDVGQAISGARLFVLSSVLEGMPNALIEAMACGLPCITTDFLPGCADEIVTDGIDGCIVPNEDTHALAKKICAVLDDDEWSRKMAKKAVCIRERLSLTKIYGQWDYAIEELVIR